MLKMTENTDKDIKMVAPDKDAKKMAEKMVETKDHKKGALICRFLIKEGSERFEIGSEYKGKNAKYLLKKKSIYKAE